MPAEVRKKAQLDWVVKIVIQKPNRMKLQKKQTRSETKKRNYARPDLKKREQIKEITETPVPITTMVPG